jgi:hypothetical protein
MALPRVIEIFQLVISVKRLAKARARAKLGGFIYVSLPRRTRPICASRWRPPQILSLLSELDLVSAALVSSAWNSRIMHNGELNGKRIPHQSAAYYAVQLDPVNRILHLFHPSSALAGGGWSGLCESSIGEEPLGYALHRPGRSLYQ